MTPNEILRLDSNYAIGSATSAARRLLRVCIGSARFARARPLYAGARVVSINLEVLSSLLFFAILELNDRARPDSWDRSPAPFGTVRRHLCFAQPANRASRVHHGPRPARAARRPLVWPSALRFEIPASRARRLSRKECPLADRA